MASHSSKDSNPAPPFYSGKREVAILFGFADVHGQRWERDLCDIDPGGAQGRALRQSQRYLLGLPRNNVLDPYGRDCRLPHFAQQQTSTALRKCPSHIRKWLTTKNSQYDSMRI